MHETKDNADPPTMKKKKKGSKPFCLLILNCSISHSWVHNLYTGCCAVLSLVLSTSRYSNYNTIRRETSLWYPDAFQRDTEEHQMRRNLIDLDRAAHNIQMKVGAITADYGNTFTSIARGNEKRLF